MAVTAVALLLGLIAAPVSAQTDAPDGYDFFGASALADGITTRVAVERFLAVEEFIALSSVSAEARLEIGRSTALAVLPDPGDLVLGLPGTLAALAGVAGLPDYPAVARADYPTTPTDEVTLAPDANVGALRLQAEAEERRAHGRAFVTDLVDTVGVIPLTVGSIKAESVARRLDPLTYESTATSTVSDIRLLGGIVRIAHVISTVTARVEDSKITATRDETKISGVDIAGMPVAIDDKGFTSPNGSQALTPVIEALAAPLAAAGIAVRSVPGEATIGPTKGVATSGFLSVTFTTLLQNAYPVVVTLSLGKASATIEASGRNDAVLGDTVGDLTGGLGDLSGVAPGALSAAGADLSGATTPADIAGALGATPGQRNRRQRGAGAAGIDPQAHGLPFVLPLVGTGHGGCADRALVGHRQAARTRYRDSSESSLSLEVVMATERQVTPARPALVQVTPEILERFRDPRMVLAIVCGLAGAVALLLGYLGVSDTLDPGQQLPYLISGGVGALFLLGLAATLLFSTDLGATRREVRELRTDIAELRELVEKLSSRR